MDRTLRLSAPAPRRVIRVLLFLGSVAAVAFAMSYGVREMLPYDALRRDTPEARFMAWEGVMWMLGLTLVFLGGAGAMGTLHWIRFGIPDWDEYRAHHRRRDEPASSLVPWWIALTGAALLALAIHARAALPG